MDGKKIRVVITRKSTIDHKNYEKSVEHCNKYKGESGENIPCKSATKLNTSYDGQHNLLSENSVRDKNKTFKRPWITHDKERLEYASYNSTASSKIYNEKYSYRFDRMKKRKHIRNRVINTINIVNSKSNNSVLDLLESNKNSAYREAEETLVPKEPENHSKLDNSSTIKSSSLEVNSKDVISSSIANKNEPISNNSKLTEFEMLSDISKDVALEESCSYDVNSTLPKILASNVANSETEVKISNKSNCANNSSENNQMYLKLKESNSCGQNIQTNPESSNKLVNEENVLKVVTGNKNSADKIVESKFCSEYIKTKCNYSTKKDKGSKMKKSNKSNHRESLKSKTVNLQHDSCDVPVANSDKNIKDLKKLGMFQNKSISNQTSDFVLKMKEQKNNPSFSDNENLRHLESSNAIDNQLDTFSLRNASHFDQHFLSTVELTNVTDKFRVKCFDSDNDTSNIVLKERLNNTQIEQNSALSVKRQIEQTLDLNDHLTAAEMSDQDELNLIQLELSDVHSSINKELSKNASKENYHLNSSHVTVNEELGGCSESDRSVSDISQYLQEAVNSRSGKTVESKDLLRKKRIEHIGKLSDNIFLPKNISSELMQIINPIFQTHASEILKEKATESSGVEKDFKKINMETNIVETEQHSLTVQQSSSPCYDIVGHIMQKMDKSLPYVPSKKSPTHCTAALQTPLEEEVEDFKSLLKHETEKKNSFYSTAYRQNNKSKSQFSFASKRKNHLLSPTKKRSSILKNYNSEQNYIAHSLSEKESDLVIPRSSLHSNDKWNTSELYYSSSDCNDNFFARPKDFQVWNNIPYGKKRHPCFKCNGNWTNSNKGLCSNCKDFPLLKQAQKQLGYLKRNVQNNSKQHAHMTSMKQVVKGISVAKTVDYSSEACGKERKRIKNKSWLSKAKFLPKNVHEDWNSSETKIKDNVSDERFSKGRKEKLKSIGDNYNKKINNSLGNVLLKSKMDVNISKKKSVKKSTRKIDGKIPVRAKNIKLKNKIKSVMDTNTNISPYKKKKSEEKENPKGVKDVDSKNNLEKKAEKNYSDTLKKLKATNIFGAVKRFHKDNEKTKSKIVKLDCSSIIESKNCVQNKVAKNITSKKDKETKLDKNISENQLTKFKKQTIYEDSQVFSNMEKSPLVIYENNNGICEMDKTDKCVQECSDGECQPANIFKENKAINEIIRSERKGNEQEYSNTEKYSHMKICKAIHEIDKADESDKEHSDIEVCQHKTFKENEAIHEVVRIETDESAEECSDVEYPPTSTYTKTKVVCGLDKTNEALYSDKEAKCKLIESKNSMNDEVNETTVTSNNNEIQLNNFQKSDNFHYQSVSKGLVLMTFPDPDKELSFDTSEISRKFMEVETNLDITGKITNILEEEQVTAKEMKTHCQLAGKNLNEDPDIICLSTDDSSCIEISDDETYPTGEKVKEIGSDSSVNPPFSLNIVTKMAVQNEIISSTTKLGLNNLSKSEQKSVEDRSLLSNSSKVETTKCLELKLGSSYFNSSSCVNNTVEPVSFQFIQEENECQEMAINTKSSSNFNIQNPDSKLSDLCESTPTYEKGNSFFDTDNEKNESGLQILEVCTIENWESEEIVADEEQNSFGALISEKDNAEFALPVRAESTNSLKVPNEKVKSIDELEEIENKIVSVNKADILINEKNDYTVKQIENGTSYNKAIKELDSITTASILDLEWNDDDTISPLVSLMEKEYSDLQDLNHAEKQAVGITLGLQQMKKQKQNNLRSLHVAYQTLKGKKVEHMKEKLKFQCKTESNLDEVNQTVAISRQLQNSLNTENELNVKFVPSPMKEMTAFLPANKPLFLETEIRSAQINNHTLSSSLVNSPPLNHENNSSLKNINKNNISNAVSTLMQNVDNCFMHLNQENSQIDMPKNADKKKISVTNINASNQLVLKNFQSNINHFSDAPFDNTLNNQAVIKSSEEKKCTREQNDQSDQRECTDIVQHIKKEGFLSQYGLSETLSSEKSCEQNKQSDFGGLINCSQSLGSCRISANNKSVCPVQNNGSNSGKSDLAQSYESSITQPVLTVPELHKKSNVNIIKSDNRNDAVFDVISNTATSQNRLKKSLPENVSSPTVANTTLQPQTTQKATYLQYQHPKISHSAYQTIYQRPQIVQNLNCADDLGKNTNQLLNGRQQLNVNTDPYKHSLYAVPLHQTLPLGVLLNRPHTYNSGQQCIGLPGTTNVLPPNYFTHYKSNSVLGTSNENRIAVVQNPYSQTAMHRTSVSDPILPTVAPVAAHQNKVLSYHNSNPHQSQHILNSSLTNGYPTRASHCQNGTGSSHTALKQLWHQPQELNTAPNHNNCEVCQKPASALCKGCSRVLYCSEQCAKKNWEDGHFKLCE